MAQTTTTSTAVFETWINKKFVSDLEWSLQHAKFTMKAIVEKGFGANKGRFVAWDAPARTGYTGGGSAAITEGSTIANEITAVTGPTVNITITEMGEFLKVTEYYDYAAVSGTRERLAKRLKDGGNIALDTNARLSATQSTNIVYATNAATGGQTTAPATISNLGASTLMLCRKVLFEGLAQGIEGVSGHPNGHYAALISPKQELDIITEVTTTRVYWSNAVVNVPGRMGQEKFVNGYIGSIYGVAVYTTQNYATQTLTSSCDIGYVYADGGVGAVGFGDTQARVVLNEVNSPYKNLNSIAWHAYYGSALISGTRVVKFYSLS